MLKEAQRLTAGHNLFLLRQTAEIISCFNKNRLEVIILKGLSLAETVYPDISRRRMADIDLLVKSKDISSARSCLTELGYELNPGNSALSYVKKGPVNACVDLHGGSLCLKEEDLWSSARTFEIAGERAKTLAVEHNIIYLCWHLAAGHGYPYKRWLEDIDRFITYHKDDIDWRSLAVKIKGLRLEIPCHLSLLKAKEVFKTRLPDEFMSLIRPKGSFKAAVFKSIFYSRSPIPWINYLSKALFCPWRELLYTVFPQKAFLKMRYNITSKGVWFYYILRPFSLFSRGIKGIYRLILR
ncbi:MAG TPA: hypothetical protein ENN78_01750 [Candidatus Omnitrophica bacterium]|nr:hypothetical protein [Candidatus Omnitrophota bacterium]